MVRCPNCNKELRFEFPYNVDLSRNDVIIICSKCKKEARLNFKWHSDFQGVYKF